MFRERPKTRLRFWYLKSSPDGRKLNGLEELLFDRLQFLKDIGVTLTEVPCDAGVAEQSREIATSEHKVKDLIAWFSSINFKSRWSASISLVILAICSGLCCSPTGPLTTRRLFQVDERVQLLGNGFSKQMNASNCLETAFPSRRTRASTSKPCFLVIHWIQSDSPGCRAQK